MIVLRVLLFPFSLLYDLITRLRNLLYDAGLMKSVRFETPIIGIGNLNAGGSGKTPMAEYLIRLLQPHYQLATLSRGYGRKTSGYRVVQLPDDSGTVGDEPCQLFRKFGKEVLITVGEDRAKAISQIFRHARKPDVILLDDAFQHRRVVPSFSVLLTAYESPFFRDHVLPMGMLRESRSGASRCDAVVITKCPEKISEEEMGSMRQSVGKYAPGKGVFFARYGSGNPISMGLPGTINPHVVLVSGIANPSTFEKDAAAHFEVVRHFVFRDHHAYGVSDVRTIADFCKQLQGPVSILTTEKDMVKLSESPLRDLLASLSWFYLPVEVSFIRNGADFDQLIHRMLTQPV